MRSDTVAAQGDSLQRVTARRHRFYDLGTIVARRYALIVAWIAVAGAFGIATPSTFLTLTNVHSIVNGQSVLLVLTLGLLPSLAAGEYDLSAASVLGLSMVMVGYLNAEQGWPIIPAALAAIGVGAAIGLINGLVVVRFEIPSLIVTLGTGTIAAGLCLAVSVFAIGGLSSRLVSAMRTTVFGLQLVFVYGVVLTLVMLYVFRFTPLGRYLFFVGAGRDVARLSGLRVDLLRVGSLLASSVVAAIAGLMLAGYLGASDPTVGSSYLLPAFAAAFLGSTAIEPGRFNPLGAFAAVYFLVTGVTGLELLGYSGWPEQVFYGTSLVGAVIFSAIVARKRAR